MLPASTAAMDFDRPESVSSGRLDRRQPVSHRRRRRNRPLAGSPRRAVVFTNPACAWSASWSSSATAAAAARRAAPVLLRDLDLFARLDASVSAPILPRLGCRRFGTGRPRAPTASVGMSMYSTVGIKSTPAGELPRHLGAVLGFDWNRPDRPTAAVSGPPSGGCDLSHSDRRVPRRRGARRRDCRRRLRTVAVINAGIGLGSLTPFRGRPNRY